MMFMKFSIDDLAKRIESLDIKKRDRSVLNTKLLECIHEWLEDSASGEWTGFTHLGLTGNRLYKTWERLEVLLDVIAFKSKAASLPIFGAEFEWSTSRGPKKDKNSSRFLRNLDLDKLASHDQATRDRAYDLSRLLAVRPEIMVFMARENHTAEEVLNRLKKFATVVSKAGSRPTKGSLLIGVLKKLDKDSFRFVTTIV